MHEIVCGCCGKESGVKTPNGYNVGRMAAESGFSAYLRNDGGMQWACTECDAKAVEALKLLIDLFGAAKVLHVHFGGRIMKLLKEAKEADRAPLP
jgi:hypothetical protein